MVLGEWAAMEGQIWPSELIDRACGAPPAGDRKGYLLAVDYAHSSVTHALLLARCGEEMWVLGEWRHDAKKRGQLSEPEQADRINTHLVAGLPVARVVVDPSAPAMRAALMDALRLPARGADDRRGGGRPAGAAPHGRRPPPHQREGVPSPGEGDARVRVGRTLRQDRGGQAREGE